MTFEALIIYRLLALLVCIGTPLAMARADGKGRRPKKATVRKVRTVRPAKVRAAKRTNKPAKVKKRKPHVSSEWEKRVADEYFIKRDSIKFEKQIPE